MLPEFVSYSKIPRLSRQCTVTEKIDGTNGVIYISPDELQFLAGSRNRWLTPEADNFGFAAWARANEAELRMLGPGLHHGEWWGSGIQRGYGLKTKKFSLFNTTRWNVAPIPACCDVVPVLAVGVFTTGLVEEALYYLKEYGSMAAPGFNNPEGVVVFHEAGNCLFKKTVNEDNVPKNKTLNPNSVALLDYKVWSSID